jgi:hypothetical protein
LTPGAGDPLRNNVDPAGFNQAIVEFLEGDTHLG